MNMGQKILKLRKARGLTQKRLRQSEGITESAIRNYELGIRSPNRREQVDGIAEALGVDPETIGEQRELTMTQAMHVLFVMEDDFGITPRFKKDNAKIFVSKNSDLRDAVKRWAGLRAQLDNGEIDAEKYGEMKDSFFRS